MVCPIWARQDGYRERKNYAEEEGNESFLAYMVDRRAGWEDGPWQDGYNGLMSVCRCMWMVESRGIRGWRVSRAHVGTKQSICHKCGPS